MPPRFGTIRSPLKPGMLIVSPEVAAVVIAADRLIDTPVAAWFEPNSGKERAELAALRRTVLELRKKREEEL